LLGLVCITALLSCKDEQARHKLAEIDKVKIAKLIENYEKAVYEGHCNTALKMVKMTKGLKEDRDEYCSSMIEMAETLPKQGVEYLKIKNVIIEDAGIKNAWDVKYDVNDFVEIASEEVIKDPAYVLYHDRSVLMNKVLELIKSKVDDEEYYDQKKLVIVHEGDGWKVHLDWEGENIFDELWKAYRNIEKRIRQYDYYLCRDGKVDQKWAEEFKRIYSNLKKDLSDHSENDFDSGFRRLSFRMIKSKTEQAGKDLNEILSSENPCKE
jgi:hypothetical protein